MAGTGVPGPIRQRSGGEASDGAGEEGGGDRARIPELDGGEDGGGGEGEPVQEVDRDGSEHTGSVPGPPGDLLPIDEGQAAHGVPQGGLRAREADRSESDLRGAPAVA